MIKKSFMLLLTATLLMSCADASTVVESENQVSMEERNDENMIFVFENVEIMGKDFLEFSKEEQEVLYMQAKYCQAMTTADIETMKELTSSDKTYTHMSGKVQTREEYFADVENGLLRYFSVGIENPEITFSEDGEKAVLKYTSVLNANAYGARGTYRMTGNHYWKKNGESWILVNEF